MSEPTLGYLRVAVDTAIRWPDDETLMDFGGHKITLSPETDDLLPSMMVEYRGAFTKDDASRLLFEFATAVAWAEGLGVNLTYMTASTCPGLMLGRPPLRRGHVGAGQFDYLPHPTDRKTKLALALFREALTVNLVPYQFLAFYRIINLHVPDGGKKQIAWINAELPLVQDTSVAKRLAELAAEPDIGTYLHVQGRCAAAHASLAAETIDPDDPTDSIRLHRDLPIVRALATRIIEYHLGVKTLRDFWRERTPRRVKSSSHKLSAAAVDSASGQESLRAADIIEALNAETGEAVQLWGQHSMASERVPDAPAYALRPVTITVESQVDIDRARAAVQRAKALDGEDDL